MSYEFRILALFVFIAIMLIFDLRNPPDKRFRFKTYWFILSLGGVGALLGMAIDSITSRISIDYFIYGKGLLAGSMLKRDILALGAKAGFSAGVFAGCFLIMANPLKQHVIHLYRFISIPLLISVLLGFLLGAIQYATNIVFLDQVSFLGEDHSRLFATVWLIHIGVYLGALLGLLLVCHRVRTLGINRS